MGPKIHEKLDAVFAKTFLDIRLTFLQRSTKQEPPRKYDGCLGVQEFLCHFATYRGKIFTTVKKKKHRAAKPKPVKFGPHYYIFSSSIRLIFCTIYEYITAFQFFRIVPIYAKLNP
jgi:hypothetical protein